MARQGKKIAKATDNRSRLQVDRSKTIAPKGRGKAISGGKAAMNVAKGVGSSAAHALRAISKPSWMSEKSMGPAIAAFMGFKPKAGNRVGPGTKIRRASSQNKVKKKTRGGR